MRQGRRNPDIVFCRHGRSLANHLGDSPFIGDNPKKHKSLLSLEDYEIPLVPAGIAQAERLGLFLKKRFVEPDIVIDSGYLRTMQTREAALNAGYSEEERLRMTVITDDRFRERECGTLRKSPKDVRSAISFWARHQKDWKANPYQARPIGGESIADVTVRTRQAILELKGLYPDKLIFVFCHGQVMQSVRVLMAGLAVVETIKMLRSGWVMNCDVHYYKGRYLCYAGMKSGWSDLKIFHPLT